MTRYLPVAALFFLGLLSKPMLVTFPFVLLLLDWWPLRRMELPAGSSGASERLRVLWPLVREKIPLLAMSIASCVVTVVAQGRNDAINPLWRVSLVSRFFNAAVSYATYLWKTVWPSSLAVLYPLQVHPTMDTHGWEIAGGLLLLAGISFLAVRQARRRPYLLTGWLWYLGTLVPVIGLVQVGDQAMADRYTYIPLIGVFLAATWGAFEFAEKRPFGRAALKVVVPAVVLSLAAAAWNQAGYWRDNVALYSHALAVTGKNWKIWINLGLAYVELGRNEEGIASYREALRIKPDQAGTWNNIGLVYHKLGMFEEGIASYREALRINPDYADAWYNLGIGFEKLGRYQQAIEAYREAIRLTPDFADAWNNLGGVYVNLGLKRQAAVFFQNALRARPDHPFAAGNLSLINR
jgi:Flp pilus assembly protein TadD